MPKFKQGRAAMKAKTEGGSRKFNRSYVSYLTLKDGESQFLKFMTDMEEVTQVAIHRFVKVKYRKDDGTVDETMRDFVSRKVGLFDDGDGTDWKDVIENKIGHEPKENFAGVALKLTPHYKGETTRLSDVEYYTVDGVWLGEDEKRFYPEWVMVFQSPSNFWMQLDTYFEERGPITSVPFKVIRKGGDRDTTYSVLDAPAPIYYTLEDGSKGEEVKEFNTLGVPAIEDVLESLGSAERYEQYFGDEDLWVTEQNQRYTSKNRDNGSGKPKRRSGTSSEDASEESGTNFSSLKKRLAETY